MVDFMRDLKGSKYVLEVGLNRNNGGPLQVFCLGGLFLLKVLFFFRN
jgi:hypothetical protein